jgi:hypothetical protein
MADVVIDLRNAAADIHSRDCPQSRLTCDCGRQRAADDLLREAAARIEVAIEALRGGVEGGGDDAKVIRVALYALTSDRKAPP